LEKGAELTHLRQHLVDNQISLPSPLDGETLRKKKRRENISGVGEEKENQLIDCLNSSCC